MHTIPSFADYQWSTCRTRGVWEYPDTVQLNTHMSILTDAENAQIELTWGAPFRSSCLFKLSKIGGGRWRNRDLHGIVELTQEAPTPDIPPRKRNKKHAQTINKKGGRLLTPQILTPRIFLNHLAASVLNYPSTTKKRATFSHNGTTKQRGARPLLNPPPECPNSVHPSSSHVRLPDPSRYPTLNQGTQFTVRRPFHPSNKDAGNTQQWVKNESSPESHA